MDRAVVVLVVAGVAFVAVVIVVRPRAPAAVTDVAVAICGAALGAGALGVQHGVAPVEWAVTVPVAALLGVFHVRALFAGAGPLRI